MLDQLKEIIINNQMIRNLILANKKLAFLNEINDGMPTNWIKIKEIGEEDVIIYYAK